jgi:hypothetical protein
MRALLRISKKFQWQTARRHDSWWSTDVVVGAQGAPEIMQLVKKLVFRPVIILTKRNVKNSALWHIPTDIEL